MTYAAGTSVPIDRTRSEIEQLLVRNGASAFGYATQDDRAMVQFTLASRHIRFDLTMPARSEFDLTRGGAQRSASSTQSMWNQACRARWRALLLVIKAKLEAIDAGISTVEEEFLAATVLPSGLTVWQETRTAIAESYELGQVTPLLRLPERTS